MLPRIKMMVLLCTLCCLPSLTYAQTPSPHEEAGRIEEHDHDRGTHPLLEGYAFLRYHSEDGLAGEFLFELHPHTSPVGFGLLLGAYGMPRSDGFFDLDARLAFHLHRPHPLDIRIFLGADECLYPRLRTFLNATLHVTLSYAVAPMLAPSVSWYPRDWGQANGGEVRIDVPVGMRVHLPYRGSRTWFSGALVVIIPDARFLSPEPGTRPHDPVALGGEFRLEQLLF